MTMKVAYVISGLRTTFVVNEMESHSQAGWDILPLVSRREDFVDDLSELVRRWCGQGLYRCGGLKQIAVTIREVLMHPLRFLRICFLLIILLFRSPVEFAKAIYELTAACYFAGRCRRFGVRHIHVHFASRSLSLGLMIGMLIGVPVSCTVHAFDIFTRSRGSLVTRLPRCCFIAAISDYNIRYLRGTCGERVEKLCRLVHCGTDLKKFKAVKRHPRSGRLLSVCSLIPKKGLEVAIKACGRMRDEGVNFHLQIVGDGPLRAALEKLILLLGLQDRVELLGRRPNDQLVDLLSEASAFVLPCVRLPSGDQDGIPVAMMEAMACRVPVVSTYISGIPELVEDGVNGYLVAERDVEALAEALKKVSTDTDVVERLGRAGEQRVQRYFNVDDTAAQIRELIINTAEASR